MVSGTIKMHLIHDKSQLARLIKASIKDAQVRGQITSLSQEYVEADGKVFIRSTIEGKHYEISVKEIK